MRHHRLFSLAVTLAVLLATPLAGLAQSGFTDEYKLIGYYDNVPADNRVARLAAALASGETTLEWRDEHGYFESFLAALDIDPASQVLVFSPTSLQYTLISARAPRALYFNDDTYIGWVKGSDLVEIATYDARFGVVFYVFHNKRQPEELIESLDQRCLVCHDSNGTTGGGTPLLLARSSIYDLKGVNLKSVTGDGNVGDRTPIAERWGGWYVTGRSGEQKHLGNVMVEDPTQIDAIDNATREDLDTLAGAGFFDTEPYLRATSDIVALLVMEHQITVQNRLGYIQFKAPAVLTRAGYEEQLEAASWDALPERAQRLLTRMLDALVRDLLLIDSATFADRISGDPAFEAWFLAQGPRDAQGRSLRELDLEEQLFRYPLSYLVYSEGFDGLPPYALDYVYRKLAAVLEGRETAAPYDQLSRSERRAALEILRETKAAFRGYLSDAAPTPRSEHGGLWD